MRPFAVLLALACLALPACVQRSAWSEPVVLPAVESLKAAAPAGRLPPVARPLAYRATLDIDPRERDFTGTVDIDIALTPGATGLWLHGDDLVVTSVRATAGGETVAASWTEVLETGVVWVGFPSRLRAGKVTLSVTYAAAFDTNLAGLFRVESQGKAYALAKSESIQARRFLPGFDEPGLKAPVSLSIIVPAGMQAIANTPEIARRPDREGHETISFAPTRPLSTYLLSVAVGPFDRVERSAIPPNKVRPYAVPLTGYARSGKGPELDFALSITPDILRAFEEMLKQPYPYEKLDIVAAPAWPSGATELAAAITYRESRILRNETTGPALLRAIKEIHAHELAHMWFGNLVTPPWWDDLWLKEAFATWSETAVLAVLEPGGGHEVAAVADGLQAMALDSLISARAVAEPVQRNEDIRNAYDAITYSKGQSIIRMVDHYFGPSAFRPALGRYIARFADGEAASADFYAALDRETGDPALAEVFRSFVSRPGVPVVTAEMRCADDRPELALSQTRYRPLGSKIDEAPPWTIPVCVSFFDRGIRKEACTLLATQRKLVRLAAGSCPYGLHPNADGQGYYRFNLTREGWRELADRMGDLPATEALAAIDSARAGFEAATLDFTLLVDMLSAAISHPDPTVLMFALQESDALLSVIAETSAGKRLRLEIAQKLSQRPEPSLSDEARDRILIFRALTLNEPAARAKLSARLEDHLSGTAAMSSDLYLAALRVVLSRADRATFDRILAALPRLNDAVFTQAFADAAGWVENPALTAEVLAIMRDGRLGPQASYSIAASLMTNPMQREAAWANLKADFPGFLRVVPAQWRRNTPRLARPFCDPARSAELAALFAQQGPEAAGHERALVETQEYLLLCAARAAHARAIAN